MTRLSCKLCALKHISQACVLLDESILGYPMHRWLACGHLAEAESELIEKYLPMAEIIRNIRIKIMEDVSYNPNLLELIAQIDLLPDT